jgi:hypothetical protein
VTSFAATHESGRGPHRRAPAIGRMSALRGQSENAGNAARPTLMTLSVFRLPAERLFGIVEKVTSAIGNVY